LFTNEKKARQRINRFFGGEGRRKELAKEEGVGFLSTPQKTEKWINLAR